MATLTYAAFVAKYEAYFAANTSQAIVSSKLREFKDDIADSFTLSAGLNWVIVQIGNWDMSDTANDKNVAHGLADHKKIRSISVIVRDDSDSLYRDLIGNAASGIIQYVDSSNVVLGTITSGVFDNTNYNNVSAYNRGWVTIGYVN